MLQQLPVLLVMQLIAIVILLVVPQIHEQTLTKSRVPTHKRNIRLDPQGFKFTNLEKGNLLIKFSVLF